MIMLRRRDTFFAVLCPDFVQACHFLRISFPRTIFLHKNILFLKMAIDSLIPNDTRIEHRYSNIEDGITYHYLLAKPQGNALATVVLLHGW